MNHTENCCPTEERTTALSETNSERTLRHTEPEWTANRHKKGVGLEVVLPGVRKEDLELEVRERFLHLEANRPVSEERGRLIYGQPSPEAYRLKLRLGDTLDGSALSAKLADGILRIEIPLVESARARKVEIG